MPQILEQKLQFKKGEILFHEGEDGDFFYFVVSGSVGVFCSNGNDRIPLAVIQELQAVGDLATIDSQMRSATAIALTDVIVAKILRSEVDEQLRQAPLWFRTIVKVLVARLRGANEIVHRNRIQDPELLSEIQALSEKVVAPTGSELVEAKLRQMGGEPAREPIQVTPQRTVLFKKGDIVFREGDPGGYFYFIVKGNLGIFRNYDKERIPLAELKELQALGEMSVADGKNRSATAVALTDVELMRITEKGFHEELEQHRFWFRALIRTIVDRLRHANEIIERNGVRDSALVYMMYEVYADPEFHFEGQPFQGYDLETQVIGGGSDESDSSATVVAGGDPGAYDETRIDVKGSPDANCSGEKVVVKADSASAKKAELIRIASNQKALLVVDPDPEFIRSITVKMGKSGVKVLGCDSIDQAQIKLANQKFGCMLINLHLKRGNAGMLIRRIRYLEADTQDRMPILLRALKADAKHVAELQEAIDSAVFEDQDVDTLIKQALRVIRSDKD